MESERSCALVFRQVFGDTAYEAVAVEHGEPEIVSGGFESKEFWKELYLIDRLVFLHTPQKIRITGIAGTLVKVFLSLR